MPDAMRILVIEDEPSLLLSLADNLRFEGYEVLTATRGDEGLALAREAEPALVLLDVMLPGLDGFAVCRELKQSHPNIKILILSARDQVVDVVRGLELGAEDYIKKPFAMAECLARVRVRLRAAPAQAAPVRYHFGDVAIDFQRMEASRDGAPLSLTTREFRLMELFVSRVGEVLSRDEILNQVWGYDVFPSTRTVDNYVLRLRKLFEEDPTQPRWILSVRGAGYRFVAESKSTP